MTIEEMKRRVAEFEAAEESFAAIDQIVTAVRGGLADAVDALLAHAVGSEAATHLPASVRGRIGDGLWKDLRQLREDALQRVKELREQKHG